MKTIALLVSLIIVAMVVVFNNKITTLQNKNAAIIQKYQQKIPTIQPVEKTNYEALESLNLQLIKARTKIQELEKKTGLNQAKTSVLKDEMEQNKQAKKVIKTLKSTIDKTKVELGNMISDSDYKKLQELESIVRVFQQKNKKIIQNNITRIVTLKEASGGILITGAIVPIIGAATLIAYATQEIGHYCQNIKDNIALEKQLFGKVLSLDEATQKNYRLHCQAEPEK